MLPPGPSRLRLIENQRRRPIDRVPGPETRVNEMAGLMVDLTRDSDIDLTQDEDVDLTRDEDVEQLDGDLRLAIALSLQQQQQGSSPPKPLIENETSKSSNTAQVVPSTGLAGLDRKQMEAERLARLKRKRGSEAISPPPVARRTGGLSVTARLNEGTVSTTTLSSRPRSASVEVLSPPRPTSIKAPSTNSPNTHLEYPNGTIKRTWVSSHPKTEHDITFAELLDAPNLQSALLSSYIWDYGWLFPHFRTHTTKFLLVVHAANPQQRTDTQQDFAGIANVRLCFPRTDGLIKCMHSKLQLLFYEARCRIVVPTANLMAFDWGEQGGVMENSVFVMDLPLLTANREKGEGKGLLRREQQSVQSDNFKAPLMQFLRAQDVPDDVLAKLDRFDFGAAARNKLAFVHTIGGAHTEEAVWRSTGHCGLGRSVARMGLAVRAEEEVDIDFVTSSVGSLTEEFLRGMYLAVAGDDGLLELGLRQGNGNGKGLVTAGSTTGSSSSRAGTGTFFDPTRRKHIIDLDLDLDLEVEHTLRPNGNAASTSTATAAITPPKLKSDAWRRNFRFFFPSHDTVARSLGGTACAGTICFQRQWWEREAPQFPRANMRDCVSVRRGVLMHNKIIFVRYKSKVAEEKRREHAGWVYVGSANLSESAWGTLVVDRAKKKEDGLRVKLNCRNWECGVLVPVPVTTSAREDAKEGLDVFRSVIPVPMVYPGKRYEQNGEMEPWFFGKKGMAA